MVHVSDRLLKNPDFNEQKFEKVTPSSQFELEFCRKRLLFWA